MGRRRSSLLKFSSPKSSLLLYIDLRSALYLTVAACLTPTRLVNATRLTGASKPGSPRLRFVEACAGLVLCNLGIRPCSGRVTQVERLCAKGWTITCQAQRRERDGSMRVLVGSRKRRIGDLDIAQDPESSSWSSASRNWVSCMDVHKSGSANGCSEVRG
ncbi:uncharacterized protein K452DRAFT_29275 [Aplosporella prunicola CBS 121167]|uniref:Uncharacterized protein n=1 Tax=Aplosporella prunicola CBS 121167 TaxID=1176127 RepID=A0A6A6AW09_9PEZI|nr:uncharacterized protein K452DRAFT_29275 [Aplosporella prunicola CBS 121167]KAF2135373.1 hypothetical protein K452DRAFT_29275 [Aplosporella prunicola CBS 121167]